MLRQIAAHVAPSAAGAAAQPFRRYDFDGGEEAPPSGRVWARSVPSDDWLALSHEERVRSLEVEGYCVLPQLLPGAAVERLKKELGSLPPAPSPDYSSKSRGSSLAAALVNGELGTALTDVAAHPPTVAFLSRLFGQPPLFMAMDHTETDPGFPGISLHCDGQPWGITEQFGREFTSPRFVKCLYALDDTTEEVSAFKVLPRSHLSFHRDGNPYLRFDEHPECVKVLMKAGDCVVFGNGVFHGNFPNTGTRSRRVLAVTYRADWAGPIWQAESGGEEGTGRPIERWEPAKLARLPDHVRVLLRDRNKRLFWPVMPNKSPDYAVSAPGISPSRHGTERRR
eukprot:COSAG01_NODE_16579_length_1224_cov_1.273778_1_plen_339_part_00